MITAEQITACDKDMLPKLAEQLTGEDLDSLVEWLNEKDDALRYRAFLLLQTCSQSGRDVYPYWDIFAAKLSSENSYQRSLGVMLLAENARWDDAGKFETLLDSFLALCDDEKPVTVRQCIQSLCKVAPYKSSCHAKIAEKLISIDLSQRKETQRKLLLLDILSVLKLIREKQSSEAIERYICAALTGGLLDAKTKKSLGF